MILCNSSFSNLHTSGGGNPIDYSELFGHIIKYRVPSCSNFRLYGRVVFFNGSGLRLRGNTRSLSMMNVIIE
jgi:hypothetical protein